MPAGPGSTSVNNLGVRLLHRTTRSVTATGAGERLFARLTPALRDLDLALGEVDAFQAEPGGIVRINAPEVAVLADWCPAIAGLFLYYPGHRQPPTALRALIDVLWETLP